VTCALAVDHRDLFEYQAIPLGGRVMADQAGCRLTRHYGASCGWMTMAVGSQLGSPSRTYSAGLLMGFDGEPGPWFYPQLTVWSIRPRLTGCPGSCAMPISSPD
jgi:hypothetical protein